MALLSHVDLVALLFLSPSSHGRGRQSYRGVRVSEQAVGLPEEEQHPADGDHSPLWLGQHDLWRAGRRHDRGSQSFASNIPLSQVQQMHKNAKVSRKRVVVMKRHFPCKVSSFIM